MSDDKLKDIITPMEYEFVELIDERFPKKAIKDAFNLFANKVPGCRLRLANDRLEKLPRAGWVRIGLSKEEAQNVKEHSEKFRAIAEEKQLPHKVMAMADLHDMTESIVSDFTPVDKITRTEKSRLESIAAKVIFEQFSYQYRVWQEYEEGKTEDAKLAKELDQIEMVNCATSIELSHPKLKEDLDAFWAYADKKIATRKGRELFNEAVGNREAMTAGKESTSEVYKKVYLSPVA